VFEEPKKSRWFTRGWTLQELLASQVLMFLDKDWTPLSTKKELIQVISDRTGICQEQLFESWRACAAETLCWAAERNTSRKEDEAYCLLGLFRINMPLLYGEGRNAFHRLQLEIIRTSSDESVFVWDRPSIPFHYATTTTLLATEMTAYSHRTSSTIESYRWMPGIQRPPYHITNQGLELRVPHELSMNEDFLLPLLVPHFESHVLLGAYAIMLYQHKHPGHWSRVFPGPDNVVVQQLGSRVRRLNATSELFIVPVD
jgi:hypothetical protein